MNTAQPAPQSFRGELHRRFTEWIYPLVFSLIALAVAGDARSHREGRINPLLTAITIALFVRWLGFFVTNQAQTNPLFSPLAYAVPIGASLVAIGFILSNRTMELPLAWAEWLGTSWSRLGGRLAAAWRRLFNVTLPLLSPSTFFVVVISLINGFQVFDQVYAMTGGGPAGSSTVVVQQIYDLTFRYGAAGEASALSWMLFVLVLGVTVVQIIGQKRWVTYA